VRIHKLKQIPPNSRVCLYGIGAAGRNFKNYLRERRPDVTVVCFADSFKSGTMDGLPVLTPEQLQHQLQHQPDSVHQVLITSSAAVEIEKTLGQLGVTNYRIVAQKLISGTESPLFILLLPALCIAAVSWYALVRQSGNMLLLSACFPVFITTLAWRLVPLLTHSHRGSDAYYFLLSRREFLLKRKLPVTLPPYFTLENPVQDYPPGFTIFLAMLPRQLLERYYWVVSPVIDAFICTFIFIYCYHVTGNISSAFTATYIYVFSQAAGKETGTLTSRQLGVLFFVLAAISGERSLQGGDGVWLYLTLFSVSGMAMLLTHKLSTQAFFLMYLMTALWTGEYRFGLLVLLLPAGTALLTGGYYLKILRGHWDFISFWTKNRRFLGAHQVNDAPVYNNGREDLQPKDAVYQPGIASTLRFIKEYTAENLYVLLALWVLLPIGNTAAVPARILLLSFFCLFLWTVGVLSYVVPVFRGIGFGRQYGKYALPFGVILSAYLLTRPVYTYGVYIVLFHSFYSAVKYLRRSLENRPAGWDMTKLAGLFHYINTLDDPLIMSLPNNYNDLIAYKCNVRVLWGGHHTPTRKWGVVIPVLRAPVRELINTYGVTHVLLDQNYTTAQRIGIQGKTVWQQDRICLIQTCLLETDTEPAGGAK